MNKRKLLLTVIIIAVVLALVYINVTTPDNIAHMDETSTILTTDEPNTK